MTASLLLMLHSYSPAVVAAVACRCYSISLLTLTDRSLIQVTLLCLCHQEYQSAKNRREREEESERKRGEERKREELKHICFSCACENIFTWSLINALTMISSSFRGMSRRSRSRVIRVASITRPHSHSLTRRLREMRARDERVPLFLPQCPDQRQHCNGTEQGA